MSAESKTKTYPDNYPSDATRILDAMSFSGGATVKLLGSMSMRSQQYAGDYDAYEIVYRKGAVSSVLNELAADFKNIIKRLRSTPNIYIGDIKAGCREEWRVFGRDVGLLDGKIVGYNPVKSRGVLMKLYNNKVITEDERKSAEEMILDRPTPEEMLRARRKIKFHTIRWTPTEVLDGEKELRDGSFMTLQEAFNTPTITKMDIVGYVQNNKYTDFSMIYEFHCGDKVLNPSFEDITKSLREDIVLYKTDNNPFKVLKRVFALAKFAGDTPTLQALTPILNSDLGRIYAILSDVGTLIQLLDDKEKIPIEKYRIEVDQFKARMANIWTLPDFMREEHTLLGHIGSALKTTSRAQMLQHLESIRNILQKSLTENTNKALGKTAARK
jgi:hypothetical protein